MNVVLQPASTGSALDHYEDTIANYKRLTEIEGFLSTDELQRLRTLYPTGRAPIWGAVEGNRSRFNRVEEGDLVLFYRDREFISRGTVTALLPDSEQLANYLWDPDEESGSYLHVFFLDKIEETSIPWSVVRDSLDYKPNAVLQRLTVLDQDKSQELLDVISEFDPDITSVDIHETDLVEKQGAEASEEALESGQGFASSASVRMAIEDHSMRRAEHYFEKKGFDTRNVSGNHPYDLRCEQGDLTIHVEVKGTQTDGEQVILTGNEVEFAREHKDRMVLFVVHSIHVNEIEDGGVEARGGIDRVYMPWNVDAGKLTAIHYKYQVPQS